MCKFTNNDYKQVINESTAHQHQKALENTENN